MPLKSLMALAAAIFAAAPVLAAPTQTPAPAPVSAAAPLKLAAVPADDPAVKAALAATDLAGAKKLLGKPGAFQGTVAQVRGDDYLLLSFAAQRNDALASFVAPANAPKFAGLSAAALGKRVLISGTFSDYQGHTEIIMTDPKQIKLIH